MQAKPKALFAFSRLRRAIYEQTYMPIYGRSIPQSIKIHTYRRHGPMVLMNHQILSTQVRWGGGRGLVCERECVCVLSVPAGVLFRGMVALSDAWPS